MLPRHLQPSTPNQFFLRTEIIIFEGFSKTWRTLFSADGAGLIRCDDIHAVGGSWVPNTLMLSDSASKCLPRNRRWAGQRDLPFLVLCRPNGSILTLPAPRKCQPSRFFDIFRVIRAIHCEFQYVGLLIVLLRLNGTWFGLVLFRCALYRYFDISYGGILYIIVL